MQLWAPHIARRPGLLVLGLALPLAALPAQWRFQQVSPFPSTFNGKVALMSLQMGVKDTAALKTISVAGNPRWLLDATTKWMSAQRLSIFALPEIQITATPLGQIAEQPSTTNCLGSLDGTEVVKGDDRFVRVRGWLFAPSLRRPPKLISIVDAQGKTAGYALTGQERADVAAVIGQDARYSGFVGYMLNPKSTHQVYFSG